MSSASAPRTSPTTIRSGRMRSAFTTSCLIVISPRPSRFGGRASSRTTCRWRSRSSAASSMVTIRSSPGIAPESAFSVVVLPEPVPPLTSTDARAATQSASSSASSAGSVPPATSSRSEKPCRRKRRTVRHGPDSDSGGITTFTREPSASRASHSGDASSTLRPSGARIRSTACISSASEPKRTPVRSSRPRRSTYTASGPFTITSSTAGSDSSGSSGPSPVASSSTRRRSASRSDSGSAPASRSTSSRTSASSPAAPVSPARARSISRARSATARSSRASMAGEGANAKDSPHGPHAREPRQPHRDPHLRQRSLRALLGRTHDDRARDLRAGLALVGARGRAQRARARAWSSTLGSW